MDKCNFPDGITIKPDGIHELDPCIYEEVEVHHNCTVMVYKCKKCGHIEIMWEKKGDINNDI